MAEPAELDARIKRLEAALDATSKALRDSKKDTADAGPDLDATKAALAGAQDRIGELEGALADAREAASRPAPTPAAAAAPASGEVDALRAEVEELRAARAMDLAEMKALLAELEPMLEAADA